MGIKVELDFLFWILCPLAVLHSIGQYFQLILWSDPVQAMKQGTNDMERQDCSNNQVKIKWDSQVSCEQWLQQN